MEFCPKCSAALIPQEVNGKLSLQCACGYKKKATQKITVKEKVLKEERGAGVQEEEEATLATVNEECPKCKNAKAYWWSEQTRASDEPETQFYRCTKCKHTWREYN